MSAVCLESVAKSYAGVEAVKDVSVTVESGAGAAKRVHIETLNNQFVLLQQAFRLHRFKR